MHTGAHRCTDLGMVAGPCDNGVILIDSVQLRTGAQVDLGARHHPGDRSWQVLYRYFRLYVKYYFRLYEVLL